MAKFGIQVSQDGTPIRDAADYQDITDDRFQYMEVIDERYYTIDVTNFTTTHTDILSVFDHNFGYIPAVTSVRTEYATNAPQGQEGATARIIVDTRGVYVALSVRMADGFFTADPVHFKFFVRTYKLNIERTFKEDVQATVGAPGESYPSYAVKALKDGETDINSPDLSRFTTNTIGKAFTVQATGVGTVDPTGYDPLHPELFDGKFLVQHDLGYPPIFFISQYADGTGVIDGQPNYLNGRRYCYPLGYQLRTQSDPKVLTFRGGKSSLPPSSQWLYLILKDPLQETL